MNWILTVGKDLKFREAIKKNDYVNCIRQMKLICDEVITWADSIEMKANYLIDTNVIAFEFNQLKEEIDEEIKDLDFENEEEIDEEINYLLDELFDLCDNTDIFIAV